MTGIRDVGDAEESKAMSLVIRPRPGQPEPEPEPEPELLPLHGPDFPPLFGPELPPVEVPPPLPPMVRAPFENSLGMNFVESGTPEVLMSVWLTRVRDFRAFVEATGRDAKKGVYSVLMGGEPRFGLHRHDWADPGFPQGDDHPVCGISWEDAKAFCKWLSETDLAAGKLQAGFEYRLPTAEEWKRALDLNAAGGKLPAYPWGNPWPPPVELSSVCNLAGRELRDGEMPKDWLYIAEFRDDYPRTSPVDAFPGNRLGIKDLFGNLSQFCEDPAGPDPKVRLIRGGSWCFTNRKLFDLNEINSRAVDVRAVDSGFRCVLVRK